jgi:2,3-bisphosphoglycerate-independent phosphoglycerate mutase
MTAKIAPVLLVIRDGWGANPHSEQDKFNAVHLARKPADDMLHAKFPVTLVAASGLDVGLPDGQMGNSEVGHENIGAGRIVDQELVRLNKLFSEKQLARNPVWQAAIVARLKARPRRQAAPDGHRVRRRRAWHVGASVWDFAPGEGGRSRRPQVFIHAFTDGRDTPPQSGLGYIQQVEAQLRRSASA